MHYSFHPLEVCLAAFVMRLLRGCGELFRIWPRQNSGVGVLRRCHDSVHGFLNGNVRYGAGFRTIANLLAMYVSLVD